jgi:hypothetical protein
LVVAVNTRRKEQPVHQIDSAEQGREAARNRYGVRWALIFLLFTAGAARAEPQPSAAMFKPVRGLVAFMSTLRSGEHPDVFVRRGLCIVENFSPFLFCGPDAQGQWEAGFRAREADSAESGLVAQFGQAYDFSESGSRAYFSLPTTWTGLAHGRRFEEHGAWAFVLERHGASWQILGYGWGVTSYTEFPP